MERKYIEIIGARENNLKNITVKIPKNDITIFTGVSGSGKSSIVFETLAQEAGRQLNETMPAFARTFLPKYSQPEADSIKNLSTAIIIDQKRLGGNSRSTLGTITDINPLLRLLFSRFASPHIGTANFYSFNDPSGMCPECEGMGKIITLDINKAVDMDKSLAEGAVLLAGYNVGGYYHGQLINSGFFDVNKKIKDFNQDELNKLLYQKPEKVEVNYKGTDFSGVYEGIAERFVRQNVKSAAEKSETSRKKAESLSVIKECPVCNGKRLSQETLNSKINGYSIHDLTDMQVTDLVEILKSFKIVGAEPIIQNLIERLENLIQIGLDYISLSRETASLSGGESQRVKMVKHLSSSLTEVLYIFDEPSVGLHPRDVHRLNELLVKIRDKGNTVIVVEHDPDVIKVADYIIDVGPKAGKDGGTIVFEGNYDELLKSNTLTGKFIGQQISINNNPRISEEFFETSKSSKHNLKNVSLRVPKGIFTCVTGVAGSGKSTLVNYVFAQEFPESIRIDQTPVGANIRSNSATYTGIMDTIRQIYADANSVSASLFSYNSDGACPKCKGTGILEVNLSFMDNVQTVCDECDGKRYKQEVLGYTYKDKNIVDVMAMTITEALEFFEHKDITSKLKSLVEVGLSYMTLGQPLSTLSGGECQRLKLAKELNKKGNIYIMDEPTTGLHMSDIRNIIDIIERLVEKGNTVIVIEHNLDIIRSADWIIDLGPDGGSRGGEIVFEGKPEDLSRCKRSITAKYL